MSLIALTPALFTVLSLLVVLIVTQTIQRATGNRWVPLGMILIYVIVPGMLANMGVFNQYTPPPPGLLYVAGLAVLTVALCLSPVGARVATHIGLIGLVVFQAFRIPVELLLHRLYVEGTIPVQMTYAGINFDIVSGITAALLGIWLLRGGATPRWLLWGWNCLGLGLLLTIVVVAILSTPAPFRQFTDGPANRLPGMFPYVWLPTVLVQSALAGHLLVFRLLRQGPRD